MGVIVGVGEGHKQPIKQKVPWEQRGSLGVRDTTVFSEVLEGSTDQT